MLPVIAASFTLSLFPLRRRPRGGFGAAGPTRCRMPQLEEAGHARESCQGIRRDRGGCGCVGVDGGADGGDGGGPETGPALESVGPMTFGPDGMLFAADPRRRRFSRSTRGTGERRQGRRGRRAAIDGKIAALLGTEAAAIAVTDLVVHPKTHNAYLSVMRGAGADAKPALLRVDGDGKIQSIALDKVKFTKVDAAERARPRRRRRRPRARLDHRHGVRRTAS